MKYVIYQHRDLLMPVTFPDHVTHSQVVIDDATVYSAGFYRLTNNLIIDVHCYGGSDSLKVNSKDGDDAILYAMFKNYGTIYFLAEDTFISTTESITVDNTVKFDRSFMGVLRRLYYRIDTYIQNQLSALKTHINTK